MIKTYILNFLDKFFCENETWSWFWKEIYYTFILPDIQEQYFLLWFRNELDDLIILLHE